MTNKLAKKIDKQRRGIYKWSEFEGFNQASEEKIPIIRNIEREKSTPQLHESTYG